MKRTTILIFIVFFIIVQNYSGLQEKPVDGLLIV